MTFETNPRFLRDLSNDAHQVKLQLPDFQRRDNSEGFIADREEKLAALAARPMGREVVAASQPPAEPEFESADDDYEEDAA